ncbi:ATP-binding cassette sub-family C member 4-like isoform X2 [Dysidea avara]|uniref:ATP-binding cassette sub-family C member 4-like isoform X2 n=1 Tax=Dysidea avara TaxID=196820 RepID=UPI00332C666D
MDKDQLRGADFKLPQTEKNPRKEATFISKLFYCWLDPIFWIGYRRELKQDDLYAAPEEARSQDLSECFNKYWLSETRRIHKGMKPRLWFALFRCLKWQILLHGFLCAVKFIPIMAIPVLLGYLSQFFCEKKALEELSLVRNDNDSEVFASEETTISRNAYLYATGLMLVMLCFAVQYTWVYYWSDKIGMTSRIIMTGAIYRKVLCLSHSTIGQLSIGHIVNLASNDVQRFNQGFEYIHELWLVPILILSFTYLLWREIGPSCLVGIFLVVFQSPVQYICARLYTKWRLKSARVTDKRVRVMNEIISGMRLIKMYAWEWAIHEYVKKIRKKESNIITQASMIRAVNLVVFYTSTNLLNFVTFSTYAGLGNTLTPKKVFSVIFIFSTIRIYCIYFLVLAILTLSEMKVAIRRIENLLLLPELDDTITGTDSDPVNTTSRSCSPNESPLKLVNEEVTNDSGRGSFSNEVTPRVIVNNLTASWTHDREKVVLKHINFRVDQSRRLLVVVGPVGSGKSSILQCLLKELETSDGSVDIEGSISYASQDPWIFSGTIKQNILFGQDYDEAWYKRVVECCCLVKDINEMPFGDETLIGERGVNLSGGQKARVNLARAVYRDSDIMLLDDPLSAVDAAVSRCLFDGCICGVLADKLVILVTHQLQYAEHADHILVLKEGCVQGYGNYEELTSSGVDPTELFDDVEDNKKSADIIVQEVVANKSNHKMEMACQKVTECPDPLHEEEMRNRTPLVSDRDASTDSQSKQNTSLSSEASVLSDCDENENVVNVVPEEERAHGTISNRTYFKYIQEGGNTLITIIFILMFILAECSIVAADWWLSEWATQDGSCSPQVENISFNTSTFDLTTHQRIGIYGGIIGVTIFIVLLRAILAFLICLAAARNLHNKMFESILRTQMLFFDTNPVGRILNRFSADTGLLDSALPHLFLHFFTILLRICAIVVVACIANYWLVIPASIIIVAVLIFRSFFLHTSRNIQRLEAISRSPLYSHISATIQGLSTIRAFKEQMSFLNRFHFYQNEHTKGWYMKISTSRWFGIRLDLVGSVFLTIVIFSSIPLADTLDPALVGLAMLYAAFLVGLFQHCIRTSAEVENLMVSVERVMAYGKLESEAELETIPHDKAPPVEWPDKGVIELHNTKFKYATDYPYALKSISFRIESCEKIGIVGRTGAGKSSLLAALFRLAEPEGLFEIDGIQITDIGLHDLRKKISIIPQDPVLFSGTVRYNLDPFNELEDHQLWNALEEVQLKEIISNLENGLESQVSEGGSNFSVGQRQLMCLARALLKRNKILVIDEATANVDLITDGIIQEMIRKKFNHCTILTIAHRLETIMDSDRVLVLSSGKVVEFDTPFNLLQKQHCVCLQQKYMM